jgi:hypothetical protein
MSEVKKVTEFTVVRDTWLRGEGPDKSYLLREGDTKQCCLGFYLEACGVPREKLLYQAAPAELGEVVPKQATWLVHGGIARGCHTAEACALMSTNDEEEMKDTDREAKLIKLFAKKHITLKFIDKAAS